MTKWVKPAVGWGIAYNANSAFSRHPERRLEHFYSVNPGKITKPWKGERFIRVALVPYTVARKAGLLRRPK